MKSVFSFLAFFIILFFSCCNKKTRVKDTPEASAVSASIAMLLEPAEGKTYRCGDPVLVRFRIHPDSMKVIDSVTITPVKGTRQLYLSGFESIYWGTEHARTGKNTLRISFYINGRKENHTVSFSLLSDIQPVNYNYRVIQQYPHDENAFTQGLIYENGLLYESTGLEGQSSLRIVTLKTGIPLKRMELEKKFFGEGIALFRDQIFQITYKTQVGFIYNKETLELIRRFDYPIKEGWGLTSSNTHLIMSDGSAQLYFLEPEYFTQVDQIEVIDHKGMVPYLNELEYINGKVLANIWYKNIIVVIDPATGKVTGQIDLEKLIPKDFKEDANKVLNGIAYNPQNKHIYVTGKNWPVLYELEITPSL
jgi:glutamine cyclotransferase